MRVLRYCILVGDCAWILVTTLLAVVLRGHPLAFHATDSFPHSEYLALAGGALLVWTALSAIMRMDGFKGGWSLSAICSQALLGVCLMMTGLLACAFVFRLNFSRLMLIYFGPLLLLGFVVIRCLARFFFESRTRLGGMRRVVILGNGNVAHELARKIAHHPEMMWEVIGFISPAGADGNGHGQMVETTNTFGLPELLQRNNVQELIVATPGGAAAGEVAKLIAHCRKLDIRVSLVPHFYQLYVSRARLLELDGVPLLSMDQRSPRRLALMVKRTMDLALTPVLAIFAAPLVLIAAAALCIRGRKPFRAEVRCGRHGNPFVMYRINIERDNPNLIGLDRLFAQLSLTELPQLWNVLRGDMSLVGPRPEPPDRVKHYSDWQRNRLGVIPGCTGLAQVHGLRDGHPSEEKARFDMQYILHWSPFWDLVLVLQTVGTLVLRVLGPRPTPTLTPAGAGGAVIPSQTIPVPEVMHADRSQPYAS